MQDALPSRAMQWALLIITTLLTFCLIGVSVIAFYWTKSPLGGLIPSSGVLPLAYMWIRIVKYLFPRHSKDYELAVKRIEHNTSKHSDQEVDIIRKFGLIQLIREREKSPPK